MEIEAFNCICDQHFDSLAELQEHWNTNNTVATGRPHYRLITGGSSGEAEGELARTQPKGRRWSTSSQIIEDAIAEAADAADWLRTNPPGARLPNHLEPGYQPEQASITCPACGMTSYSMDDIRQGYCGLCHDWTSGGSGG